MTLPFYLYDASLASTLLSGVQTDLMSSMGEAVPIAGGVMAAIAGVMLAVKLFKRLTGART